MQLSVIFKLNLVSFFLLFTFWVLCIKNKTKTNPRWTTRTICQNIFATSYWIINSIQIGPYSFFSPQQLRKKQKIKGGKYFQPVAAFNLKNLTKQSKQREDFFSVAALNLPLASMLYYLYLCTGCLKHPSSFRYGRTCLYATYHRQATLHWLPSEQIRCVE